MEGKVMPEKPRLRFKKTLSGTQKLAALKNIPLFSNLNQKELKILLGHSTDEFYDKNSVLFEEGDFGETVFLITAGKVRITTRAASDRTKILGVLGEGDFLGEMAIIEGEYRSATAIAHEDVQTITISKNDFLDFVVSRPELSLKIMKSLCGRIREANEALKDLAFYDLPGRLAKSILSLHKKFSGEEDGAECIEMKITHQELADMLGTARESVTKILNQFKKEGSIDYRNRRIYVLNRNLLKEWVR